MIFVKEVFGYLQLLFTIYYLQGYQSLHVHHVSIIQERHVTVWVGLKGLGVHYPLVEHQSISFDVGSHFEAFPGRIAGEEVEVHDLDVSTLVLRLHKLFQEILPHYLVFQLLSTSDIEGEPSYFAALVSIFGPIPIVLGASRGEVNDVIITPNSSVISPR